MTTLAEDNARITVDLPRDDYNRLKIAAAVAGRGQSMSSLVRQVVHTFLNSDDSLQDVYDAALIRARQADQRPFVSDAEVRASRATTT